MSKLDEVGAWAQERLPALLAEHQVPGAALAVFYGEEMAETAAGVLSKATGVQATTDSVFQVGSITKVWTTTLAMQLADEGKLDIDARVRSYLPEFAIADEDAAAQITVRQLMCHEVLRDKPYDDCLRDNLFKPLQLTHAAASPYEAILYRAAVGHIQPSLDADWQPAPVWSLVRSNAPAGAVLSMRPRDLLTFVRMHLAGGAGPDGAVLSTASVQAMQERQVKLPDLGILATSWGLGWEIFDFPTGTVIGHDGGTIGQSAYLRVAPGHDVGVALLTNGGNTHPVYQEVVGRVLRDLTGIELPPMPAPAPQPPRIDASRYLGTYTSAVGEAVVSQDGDGRIWLNRTPKGIAAELGATQEKIELVAWRGDTLIAAEAEHGVHMPHAFLGDDGHGHTQYMHTGRADRRQPD
jgi:CubicO group peptidase (beta-lactamase class C family)